MKTYETKMFNKGLPGVSVNAYNSFAPTLSSFDTTSMNAGACLKISRTKPTGSQWIVIKGKLFTYKFLTCDNNFVQRLLTTMTMKTCMRRNLI